MIKIVSTKDSFTRKNKEQGKNKLPRGAVEFGEFWQRKVP